MNSMNDLGEFQDVESNLSGRLSDVSSQLVRIPGCRSLLSRDKGCRLIHGNNPEYRIGEAFFFLQINFLRLIHLEILPERVSSEHVHRNRELVPGDTKVKTSLICEDGQNYGTIQCRWLLQSR